MQQAQRIVCKTSACLRRGDLGTTSECRPSPSQVLVLEIPLLAGHIIGHFLVHAVLIMLLIPIDKLLDALPEGSGRCIAQLLGGHCHISIGLEHISCWRHWHVVSDGLLAKSFFDAIPC